MRNMILKEALADLKRADKTIKQRHRYQCGLERIEEREDNKGYRGFFSSPDSQNSELYHLLRTLGWRNAGYSAPYYWRVSKGTEEDLTIISYTEGDIAIYKFLN